MSDVAIRVEGLGKQYRIGRRQERYKALRDTLADLALTPLRAAKSLAAGQRQRQTPETIWALKDVSFEVRRGEVVGVIGRNGAGKSTLLKVLSRITEPTKGTVDICGRVGSLLEVGTGFHPELTGRENIYLNGAILGMKKAEIERRFDEIVAFAETEQFIDTPVKHYSSGMQLRLAFAVAAHLEPEILLVDEVLAVGDAAFQRKCLGIISDAASGGRAVLFVSHDIGSVSRLCGQAMYLSRGTVVAYGPVQPIVEKYLNDVHAQHHSMFSYDDSRHVSNFEMVNKGGSVTQQARVGDAIGFKITLKDTLNLSEPVVSMFICDHWGKRLIMLGSRIQERFSIPRADHATVLVRTDALFLLPGTYTVDIGIGSDLQVIEYIQSIARLEVVAADVFGTGRLPSAKQGVIAQRAEWHLLK